MPKEQRFVLGYLPISLACGQYGNSINVLAAELARKHGFNVIPEHSQTPDSQSFFTRQFIENIVIGETALVGENRKARALWMTKMITGYIGVFLIIIACITLFSLNIDYNSRLLHQQRNTFASYTSMMQQASINPLINQIQPLSELRELNQQYNQPKAWYLQIGLQDNETAHRVSIAYHQQLRQKLILPLSNLQQERLEKNLTDFSTSAFDDLHYYLMLYQSEIRDSNALERHFEHVYMNDQRLSVSDRQALKLLLKDLWSIDVAPLKPDRRLVARAKASLASQVDEKIVYEQIKSMPEFSDNIDLRELFGADFQNLFIVRSEIKKDSFEFPRFFTRSAYQSLDLSPTSHLLRKQIASLNRIRNGTDQVSQFQLISISSKVRELYFQEYIHQWNSLLENIDLRPLNSPLQINRHLAALYKGDNALLYKLISVIASETNLAETVSISKSEIALKNQLKRKSDSKIQAQGINTNLLDSSLHVAIEKSTSSDSAQIVNNAFKAYASYLQNRRKEVNPVLEAIFQDIQGVIAHYDTNQALNDHAIIVMNNESSNLNNLWTEAAEDETRASQWLKQLADMVWSSYMSGAGLYIQTQWNTEIYPFWQQQLGNRFPLEAGVVSETRIGDFIEFFKPKGTLENYEKNTLSPFLIETLPGWRIKTFNDNKIQMTDEAIHQLNLVRTLRERLFSADGTLQIDYKMRARELTSDITEFSLRDNNGRFIYRHGPRLWQKRKWPVGEDENLTITMSNNNLKLARKNYTGPWAWFRFVFDCDQWQNGEKIVLKYAIKGYKAEFELALDRRGNPFSADLLNKINLPARITF